MARRRDSGDDDAKLFAYSRPHRRRQRRQEKKKEGGDDGGNGQAKYVVYLRVAESLSHADVIGQSTQREGEKVRSEKEERSLARKRSEAKVK